MWCSNCQQDLPAIATPEEGKVRCTQCRHDIALRTPTSPEQVSSVSCAQEDVRQKKDVEVESTSTASEVPSWAFVERTPIDFDAWRWDPDLLEAERLLKTLAPSPEKTNPFMGSESRVDSAHGPATNWLQPAPQRTTTSLLAWIALSMGGLVTILAGIVLGFESCSGQKLFLNHGLSYLVGGEASLIVGLLLQLERISRNCSRARRAIAELDEQVEELRRAAVLGSRSHVAHAPPLYSHLATGASSHLLWTELSSQLDRLAMRVAHAKALDRE